jgi:hypothetical protein
MATRKPAAPKTASRKKPATASSKTSPAQKPPRVPPYTDPKRNHGFLTLEHNPLTEAQMGELEKLVSDTLHRMIGHGGNKPGKKPGKKGPVTFHPWIRVIP